MNPGILPLTMTVWAQTRYGGADTLEPTEVPVPAPGKKEVLLRIRATGLNSGDVRVMRGEPLLVRLAFGLCRPKNPVRGMDAAATVAAVGTGVESLAVGDEVIGELPGGALAPYAVVAASRLVTRPATLDAVTAATLPVAGGTAWQAFERAGMGGHGDLDGRRVLVIGASSGVGTFAVQLAALRGAQVHALCGERNRALVESIGAVHTWDYRANDAATLPAESYDLVIDIAGTAPLRTLQRLVVDGGVVALVSGEGGRLFGPVGRILRANALSLGSKRRLIPIAAVSRPDVLTELVALAAAGRITPVLERTWPFDRARDAMEHMDAGHAAGKVVVLAG
ncbi:NAD(P)-dependent alcohol dehydrogenase [Microbacterium sp.]|uniref:NAD(P)-dependent alcohol dehydrogenase n=1 Tax=Microbacterium sp. TaxID=51671 RepID=UPI0025EB9880|nr:NAD(P)-dependent alcohol dehydrogenase [Microbacterium sp.]